jgi:hypothetical protein
LIKLSLLSLILILLGRVDTDRITSAGHSFGGSTALVHAKEDKRVSCVVTHDPWMVPMGESFVLTSAPALYYEGETYLHREIHFNPMMTQFAASHPASRSITLLGTGHLNFCDMAWFVPFILMKLKIIGELDRNVALKAINRHSLAFIRQCQNNDRTFDETVAQEKGIIVHTRE